MPIWLRRFTTVVCCLFAFWGLKILAQAGPTLRLSKTGTTSVSSGGTISYALTFENGFDETARDVVIEDSLPAGTYFLSASDGANLAGDRVTFRLGAVGAHSSKTVVVRVQVPFEAKAGREIKSGSATVKTSNLGSASAGSVSTLVSASRSSRATGKIVFSTRRAPANERQIYSINPDGSGLTQLTNDDTLIHSEVALSADGSKIAFLGATRSTANPLILNPPHLYVMNAQPQSATNQPIQITNETAGNEPDSDSTIGWNPNGIQVVYTSFRSFHLVADLTPQTSSHGPIFLNVFNGADYNFSPDGKSLVFTTNRSSTDNDIETLRLDTDANGRVLGSSDKPVVLFSDGFRKFLPAFNPDGSKIAFVQKNSTSGTRNSDLYVIDVASKAQTRLTTGQNVFESGLGSTSWSPDGTLITFGSDGLGRKPDGTLTTQGVDGVYLIKPAPATEPGGDNFPQYISEGNTSYYPHFAQVSLPGNTTSLSGNLRKTATASADPFGTSISTVPQGGTIFYHIFWSLKNGTGSAISTATIQDQIPAGTTYASGGDATQFDSNGAQFVVFNLGAISAGATVSGNSTFSVKVSSSAKVDDVILNPGGRYFALSNGVKLFGDNPVTLKVTAAVGKLLLTNKLLKVNGQAVTDQNIDLAPNDELLYLLTFDNQTANAVKNLVATDRISGSTTLLGAPSFSDASGNAIAAPSGGAVSVSGDKTTATYTLASLGAGAKAYAIIGAKVNADAANGLTITNRATLVADGIASQSVSSGTQVAADATLSLSKSVISINGDASATTGTVLPGDTIRYLLKFSNTGRRAATNLQIIDPIPLNTRASSVDFTDSNGAHIDTPAGSSANLTAADGTVTFKVPTLAAGATGYAGLTVSINNDAASKATQISNVNYRLTADGGFDIKNLPAINNPLRAPLSISKKLALLNAGPYNGTDKVRPGDLLTYEIKVSNPSGNGAVVASNLTVTDFIPLGTTFKNVGSGGTFNPNNPPFVSYAIPTLAVGESKTLQFSVTVDAGTTSSIVNRDYGVQIGGLNRRFTGPSVTTPVFVAAGLTVSKTATVIETGSTTQVAPGQNIREVFTVTNTGGSSLSDVTLVVPVNNQTAPSQAFLGTTSAPVAGAAPIYAADGKTLTFKLGAIGAGQNKTATLETQVKFLTSAKTIVLGADSATAGTLSASDAAITLSVGGNGPPRPNLLLGLSASLIDEGPQIKQISAGERFTLKYDYANLLLKPNSGKARGAFIISTLPSIPTSGGTALPQIISSTAPYTVSNGVITWKLGDLVAGDAPQNLKLVVSIPSNATVGKSVEFDGNLDAANYGGVSRDTVPLAIIAPQNIDLRVAISGSADDKQPRTGDGRLKPPAVIDYQIIASNAGDATATNVDVKSAIPSGTILVPDSARISKDSGTIRKGTVTLDFESGGRANGIHFKPGAAMKPNDSFVVAFSVRIQASAPQNLTSISDSATLTGTAPNGKAQTVASNIDTQRVFIPAPPPARLALEVDRAGGGPRNVPFTTTFIVTNTGGETAKNVILRYSFKPENEFFQSASDGGTLVGVSALPRTVFWDGAGGSQASKFANLKPGEFVVVTLITKPKNDKNLLVLTGQIAETLQKNTPGATESNPITRNLPPQYIITGAFNAAVRGAAGVRSAAGSPNVFSALGDFFKFIGASVGNVLFGGGKDANPALTAKLPNFDPAASRTITNAGEDSLSLTLKSGRTVTITPLIVGELYRIQGPQGVISNDGGSLVASGGGNFSIKTDIGNRSVSQIFAALISQDGGGFKGKLELYNGGSGKLISQDGGGLISQDGGGIIPFSSLISQDGGGLISQDGGGILAKNSLISQDGGGFKLTVGASLISQDGGGLVASGGGNLVASGGGNLVASGGGNIYNFQGADLHGQMSSSLVASGGGNLVASGGGN